MSSFEDRLAQADLPPPGPAHFAARRALWCTPTGQTPNRTEPLFHPHLEELLHRSDIYENEKVWEAGIGQVWNGLIKGARLRKRLPLSTVVLKVLQCGWVRDGTWPKGATVPESDDEHEDWTIDGVPRGPSLMSTATSDCVSGKSSPWSTEGRNDAFQSFALRDARSSRGMIHHPES
ncbi:hypothetical protein OBBRIDRAFT_791565 [Obba rivulosa]|uniref:DUF4050 domain-containing protein n=1 Tax=Obba rivulosa TaxID=1052685 RepID=A0A8E2B1G1_9APHY|nr:hypothetical protein OBBRIDRAFT_791565 [Obba rivulosa]